VLFSPSEDVMQKLYKASPQLQIKKKKKKSKLIDVCSLHSNSVGLRFKQKLQIRKIK